MAKTFIHATITLDGYMADSDGGIGWMDGLPAVPEDFESVSRITSRIGAIVGGASRDQSIDDDGQPYGGMLQVPVYLMTHREHEPIEKDGTTYTFIVDDIAEAVEAAKKSAGENWVSILGGSVSRQSLQLGLVDEIYLDVVPLLLGDGVSLFSGLGEKVKLERLETSAFAGEVHLRYAVQR